MLQTLWERMKHMFFGETALTQTEQEAAGGAVRAAREWMDLFCGKAQWLLDGSVQSLQLPCAIAGELARLVTVELEGRVCAPLAAEDFWRDAGAAGEAGMDEAAGVGQPAAEQGGALTEWRAATGKQAWRGVAETQTGCGVAGRAGQAAMSAQAKRGSGGGFAARGVDMALRGNSTAGRLDDRNGRSGQRGQHWLHGGDGAMAAGRGDNRAAARDGTGVQWARSGGGHSAVGQRGARAAFLQEQLDDVLRNLRTQCEYAIAGGSLVFKPYVEKGRVCVDFVRADGYLPTQWNGRGDLTGAVFIEQVPQRDGWYTRLERHTLAEDGYHVQNSAFYSATRGALGGSVPLSAVPQWASLEPEWVVRCADGSAPDLPLFAVFKMPFANQNDPSSPTGVSAYSRAAALLEQADRQYSRVLWEYEGSELAVDASVGAVLVEDGRTRLPRTAQRLFRELGVDKGDGGDLYSVFSPAIRDESLFNGLENLLRRIEFACYLSYGTLSNAQQVEKTAEEIKMSRQRSYSAVCDMQKSLAVALTQLVDVIDRYATLYRLAPEGDYEVAFSFGDAVTTDTAAEREAMRADCRDGAAAWWEYRMRFYGECEDEARRKAAAVATDEISLNVEQPRKNNVLQEEKE